MQTLLKPIFSNIMLDTYFFFVPNRLVWEHWRECMGENTSSPWIPSNQYSTPQMTVNGTDKKVLTGTIEDYMGQPVGVDGISWNALPIRGYHLIWSEFFRDENLQQPLNIYKGDATKYLNAGSASDDYSELYPWPRKAARYHDYFSSCLPAPQKGPDVKIPIGSGTDYLPVYTRSDTVPNFPAGSLSYPPGLKWFDANNAYQTDVSFYDTTDMAGHASPLFILKNGGTINPSDDNVIYPNNLWAQYNIDSVTMASINDLRQAFQIQRMYERDALGGSRYIELIKSHFGITSPDARLQRPEYLGGNRIPVSIHEVVNGSESASYKLGNLGAMAHTADYHEDFIKSFTEHGFVIGVMVARYPNLYAQGQERFWSRSDRFSYYWPTLSHLGNQSVLNKELYAQGSGVINASTGKAYDEEVFGYQEAWADLRYKPSRVSGEMRPGISGTLDSWHLADYYTSMPYLSAGWIESNPSIVDRVLAVGHSTSNQIFADIEITNIATRVMPMYSVPGLIDHF